MAQTLPPDLRVLCRKLTAIPHAQLPHALPALTSHVLRSKDILAAPQEAKPKDDASQAAHHVHKLRTSITTLLNSRSKEARFAAVGLVKALVDVGGWEMLRVSQPWVGAILSVVQVRLGSSNLVRALINSWQKGDPYSTKELAVVVLSRLYSQVHPYQTLVREIATPTIPAFVTACLQIIKVQAPQTVSSCPLGLAETICDAFSTLIPLYPTIFRPHSSAIKSAVRPYLAPTESDATVIPFTLRRAARKITVSLHCVAAKSGGSEEWTKLADDILRQLHSTADQVLRAVDESWEGTAGYNRAQVDPAGEPSGGGPGSELLLPTWSGIGAGAERLTGLLAYLADMLRYPTKSSVTVPVGAMMDAVSRICLIARQSPKTQTWEQAVETNAAIGRDEKDELWSVMPDLHLSALQLLLLMSRRCRESIIPFAPEILDHLARVFKSAISNESIRETSYVLLDSILLLSGPSLSKATVVMLEPIFSACCRDLQEDAGYLKPKPSTKAATSKEEVKKNKGLANADLFLKPQASSEPEVTRHLGANHKAAAENLLADLAAYLPQQHLKPTLRGLVDKTSILTRNRDAMLASVLNPYKDQHGRMYPSILPHMSRAYPHDQGLEILRSNLRMSTPAGNTDLIASVDEVDESDHDEEMATADDEEVAQPADATAKAPLLPSLEEAPVEPAAESNPFMASKAASNAFSLAVEPTAEPSAKRKLEDAAPAPSKRQETTAPEHERIVPAVVPTYTGGDNGDADDSDDESVHLNMELDEEDDDEEE